MSHEPDATNRRYDNQSYSESATTSVLPRPHPAEKLTIINMPPSNNMNAGEQTQPDNRQHHAWKNRTQQKELLPPVRPLAKVVEAVALYFR